MIFLSMKCFYAMQRDVYNTILSLFLILLQRRREAFFQSIISLRDDYSIPSLVVQQSGRLANIIFSALARMGATILAWALASRRAMVPVLVPGWRGAFPRLH
jgi:hypothetical protein